MTHSRAEILARTDLFVSKLQALYDADYTKNYPVLKSPRIGIDLGGVKYLRITVTQQYAGPNGSISDGQRSVYCFIDLRNGDILKAAGWKAPAKGARGNIFNDECDVGTRATVHGGGLYAR